VIQLQSVSRPAQPGGQQPSPLVHVVVTSQLWSTQLPVKHLFAAVLQSAGPEQAWQLGLTWHIPSMQLPVKHGCWWGLHCTCLTHAWQLGMRVHSPLMQSPVRQASLPGSQSLWPWHSGPPPVELDAVVPHSAQEQPG
jgi:hypothetical protein